MTPNTALARPQSDVTVVIPFYNRSNFARRLLQSVVEQTRPPKYVYFIDNGSQIDQKMALLKTIGEFAAYPHLDVRYFETERTGNANIARNLGIALAQSRYIAFLDSDDWWEPSHLEQSLSELSSTNKSGVYSGSVIHSAVTYRNTSKDIATLPTPFHLLFSSSGWSAQTSTYVLDKMKMGAVNWDESLRRHQDYDFFLAIEKDGGGWAFNKYATGNLDRSDALLGRHFDFKSMIKFLNKWEADFPTDCLRPYLLSQMDLCLISKAPERYYNYYRLKFIKTKNGLTPRLASSPMARKIRQLLVKISKELSIYQIIKSYLGKR